MVTEACSIVARGCVKGAQLLLIFINLQVPVSTHALSSIYFLFIALQHKCCRSVGLLVLQPILGQRCYSCV